MFSQAIRSEIAVGLAALLLISSCVAPAAPAGTVTQDELRIALTTLGTEVLDPVKGPNFNSRYLQLMFDPLVGVDRRGEQLSKETGLARDWTVSADMQYTFTLREGVKFHNGDEVTADDVKFSLERLRGPGVLTTYGTAIAGLIDSISVSGKYQVDVRLKRPNPTFLTTLSELADTSGYVMPKTYFESVGADGFASKPIGSGPYKFTERQVGAFMKFEQAFPTHFSVGTPRFKRVTLRLVVEDSTRLAMLKAGDVDFIDVGTDQVAGLKGQGFKTFAHGAESVEHLLFQLQRPEEVTRDINLRKALSHAIDRAEIARTIMGGFGTPAGNLFPHQVGSQPLGADQFDPAKAKQFLDQTDYREGGKKLTLQIQGYPTEGWPQMLSILAAIQAYWRKIGVDSVITYRDLGALRTDWSGGRLPASTVLVFNYSGRLDWQPQSRTLFACSRAAGARNVACDPELDKLIDAWGSAQSQAEYGRLAVATEKYARDQYYAIPVVTGRNHFASNQQIPDDFSPGLMPVSFNVRGLFTGLTGTGR